MKDFSAATKPWWQSTVIYQIYPRSYQDSNGDGIGDIQGIISRLDYLQDLGVETIWFSPFFSSPQKDFGYDISDYKNIAPEYGSMADVEELIAGIHRRGMKIVFDMVMNHTSDKHAWFQESKSSRNNPKADWYIWRDGKGKNPPNNWKSIVWGLGWHYAPERDQWYFASFLPFQPDLNYQNPEVKAEMFNTVRFWLDKGVDGFRLDIFNCIVKDLSFRDNPFTINPFPTVEYPGGNFQIRKYSVNHPDNFLLAKELRAVMDEYGEGSRFLLGEVFGSQDIVKKYLGKQDGLHLIFLFETLYFQFKATWFKKLISDFEQQFPAPLIPTWVLGNHDIYRYTRRIGNDLQKAKLMAVLQLTVRAVPTLYYGEEVGMKNAEISPKIAQDPLAEVFRWIPQWFRKWMPVSVNRDVCRTPMQWNSSRFAGFSSVEPWVQMSDDTEVRNVASLQQDKDSLWHWYRQLLALRKAHGALHSGAVELLDVGNDQVLAYERVLGEQRLRILINFSSEVQQIKRQAGLLLLGSQPTFAGNQMPALSAVVLDVHHH
jgi:alpha-glucosidase